MPKSHQMSGLVNVSVYAHHLSKHQKSDLKYHQKSDQQMSNQQKSDNCLACYFSSGKEIFGSLCLEGADIEHTRGVCADITVTSEYVAYVIVISAHTTYWLEIYVQYRQGLYTNNF